LRMPADVWTTVAAFTAAGLSVMNVAMTGLMNSKIQLTQWRRTTEVEIFAEVSQRVDRYTENCLRVAEGMNRIASLAETSDATALQEEINKAREGMDGDFKEILQQLSKLEAIAGAAVVSAGQKLAETLRVVIYTLRPGGSSDKVGAYQGHAEHIEKCRANFVKTVRVELGTEKKYAVRKRFRRRTAHSVYDI
jgi:hypothetical protein